MKQTKEVDMKKLSIVTSVLLAILAFGAWIPNVQAEDFDKVLLMAAKTGDVDMARKCLEKGADVNYAEKGTGVTAIIAASLNGNKELVEMLLDKGSDVNAKTIGGVTALMAASLNNRNVEVAKLLLERGAKVNEKTKHGATALKYAVFLTDRPRQLQFMGKTKSLTDKPVENAMTKLLKKHGATE